MNKKVIYRVSWYVKKQYLGTRIAIGHSDMLSIKRQLKRLGYDVKVEKYEK